ncbi:hypothetical protein F5Y03DRAFT_103059 [Xylaria venustula]|nr:hypothetical protein F5Y03DRAFT_103059 [Xylaria venustula]
MPRTPRNSVVTSHPMSDQDRVEAIMGALPPTEVQYPKSKLDTVAKLNNEAILAVRGLRTTAKDYELAYLADMACSNGIVHPKEIAAKRARLSSNGAAPVGESSSLGKSDEAKNADSDIERPLLTFQPFYFFFYGSLQLPSVLDSVCDITTSDTSKGKENERNKENNAIVLRKGASIAGWKIKMWGPYPALVVADEKMDRVQGVAWLCEKTEHVAKLCTYESEAYRMAYCDVEVPAADGNGVEIIRNARTFVSNRPDELRDGEFSIEEYQRDMLFDEWDA